MAKVSENTVRTFDLTGLTENELIALHGALSHVWAWQSDDLSGLFHQIDDTVGTFSETPTTEYGYGPWTDHRDLDEPPF
jgi:hypothetical protein